MQMDLSIARMFCAKGAIRLQFVVTIKSIFVGLDVLSQFHQETDYLP